MALGDDWDRTGIIGDDGTVEADIQSLLDTGYEQLDGYMVWAEGVLGLDTRTTQQDCFNAESLVDYLANSHRKPAAKINEFELRWFVFSHYVRNAMADDETAERLPDSLLRFYDFLADQHSYLIPEWLPGTLDDRTFYLNRRRAYNDLPKDNEREWQRLYRNWSEELVDDLDTRCLWTPLDLGDGTQWRDPAGWREATLHDEAIRLWQEERAELLWQGQDFDSIREHLGDSYLTWLNAPQAKLDDMTPLETIQAEREELDSYTKDEAEDEPDE